MVVATVLVLLAAVVAQDLPTSVSNKCMESILNDMGADFEKKNDTAWRLDLNGKKILLIMGNDDTDAQLYIGFGDTKVGTSKMNLWNKEHRFSWAFADDDGNPVLESDLDFAGGTNDDTISTWIKLYKAQGTSYVKFLSDCGSRPARTRPPVGGSWVLGRPTSRPASDWILEARAGRPARAVAGASRRPAFPAPSR